MIPQEKMAELKAKAAELDKKCPCPCPAQDGVMHATVGGSPSWLPILMNLFIVAQKDAPLAATILNDIKAAVGL